MQTINPYSVGKEMCTETYDDQSFYPRPVWFKLECGDFNNKNISIIVYTKDLLENLINFEQSYLSYELYFQTKCNSNTMVNNRMSFSTNKYFCKQIGKKIKYTDEYIKIPVIGIFDSPLRNNNDQGLMYFNVVFYFLEKAYNSQKHICENTVLQLKNTTKHTFVFYDYYLCCGMFLPFGKDLGITTHLVKYIYFEFDCLIRQYFTYKKKSFLKITNKKYNKNIDLYDHYFDNLVNRYSNVVMKIKIRSSSVLIIFKIDERTHIDNDFYSDLQSLINKTREDKCGYGPSIYVIF